VEGNRTILMYGLPISAVVVLAVLLLPPVASRPILYGLLLLGSLVLVFLVLIQRGKGGGLAGALGGMGGSSAFGTRAGDVFTMITIVAASFWILSAMALAKINLAESKNKAGLPTVAPADRKLPSGITSSDQPSDKDDADRPAAAEPGTTPADGKRFLDESTPTDKKDDSGANKESNN